MRVTFLGLGLLLASVAHAGGLVGNGGDVVVCGETEGSAISGTLALDYVLTYRQSNGNADLAPVASLSASLARIEKNIRAKLPELAESFHEFESLLLNEDVTLPRFWEEAPFGLVDLRDEEMVASVPAHCRNGDGLRIQQAVVRQDPEFSGTADGRVIYRYHPGIYARLEREYPLQLSFLLIHEWLWDLSGNVDRNRRINRFLHSSDFDRLDAEQVRYRLKAFGLPLPSSVPMQAFAYDSCPADPAAARALLRDDRASPRQLASDFGIYSRGWLCRTGQDCEPAWDQTIHATRSGDPDSAKTIELFSRPTDQVAKLWISWTPRGASEFSFRCRLSVATAHIECDPAYVPGLSERAALAGSVGAGGCLRLFARQSGKDSRIQWARQAVLEATLVAPQTR